MSRTRFYLLMGLVALVGCITAKPARWVYRYNIDESTRLVTSVDVMPCWGDIADCERTTPRKPLYGSFIVPAASNIFNTVGQWYWDPSTLSPATACASDGNNCTSSTCGAAGSGIGPCATYTGIMTKLGASQTYSWSMAVPVVMTAISSQDQSLNREPVSARPFSIPLTQTLSQSLYGQLGAGAVLTINTTPAVLSSGTIAGLVAKVRGTTAFSMTTPTMAFSTASVTDGGLTVGYGQLIYNVTRGSYSIVSVTGGVYSQPMTLHNTTTPKPGVTTLPTEDDTWANGDSYQVLTLQSINLTDLEPINGGCLISENCGIMVDKVNVPYQYSSNGGDDVLTINAYTYMQNSLFAKEIKLSTLGNDLIVQGMADVAYAAGFSMMPGGVFSKGFADNTNIPKGYHIFGGGGGNNTSASRACYYSGVVLDADTQIPSPNCRFADYNYAGAVNLTGALTGTGGGVLNATKASLFANLIYGSGTLDAGEGKIIYKSGAGGAVSNIGPISTNGTLNIMSQTLACLGIPSVATPTLTCNKTVSATNLDADLGATSGCYFVEGGGSFCNFGP